VLRELAPSISAYRFFDLGPLALGGGLRAELAAFYQSVDGIGDRWSFAAVLGPVLAVEAQLSGALFLRAELGASTYILRRARIAIGEEAGSEISTPLTAGAALGVGWIL
jgi:hypothetical protein